VAELVDALDLGSSIARCVGSSPSIRTTLFLFIGAMGKVLVIKADENKKISDLIEHSATVTLEASSTIFDTIIVPRALEIPSAMSFAVDSAEYDGIVCIGCVMYSTESEMEKIIFNEVLRSINEFAVHYAIPVGIGISLVTKKKSSWSKSCPDLGVSSANAILHMIKLKRHFNALEDDRYSVGQKHN